MQEHKLCRTCTPNAFAVQRTAGLNATPKQGPRIAPEKLKKQSSACMLEPLRQRTLIKTIRGNRNHVLLGTYYRCLFSFFLCLGSWADGCLGGTERQIEVTCDARPALRGEPLGLVLPVRLNSRSAITSSGTAAAELPTAACEQIASDYYYIVITRFSCQKARYVLQTSCSKRLPQSYLLSPDPSKTQSIVGTVFIPPASRDSNYCPYEWRAACLTAAAHYRSSGDQKLIQRLPFKHCSR